MGGFGCLFLVGVLLGWGSVWWILTGVIVTYFCALWLIWRLGLFDLCCLVFCILVCLNLVLIVVGG